MKLFNKFSLDYARFLAALMIVAIHIYPFESLNPKIDYLFTRVLFRIAVPLFLMITGYFLLPKVLDQKEKLIQYTKKILKLYLLSILIYFPLNIYMGDFKNLDLIRLIQNILINGTFYHLWYFPALILGIWITYYLLKKVPYTIVKVIVFLLYVIGLFGDSYYGMIQNISFVKSVYDGFFQIFDYTRNGLFYVPIFLILGYDFNHFKKNRKRWGSVLFVGSFLLLGVEGMLLHQFSSPRHTSMYLFLIPCSYFLFCWLLKYPNGKEKENPKLRNWSTWIYILHPFLIVCIRFVAKVLHLEKWMIDLHLVNYFFVILATLSVIWILEKGMEMVSNGKK